MIRKEIQLLIDRLSHNHPDIKVKSMSLMEAENNPQIQPTLLSVQPLNNVSHQSAACHMTDISVIT
jgi:hypothetical protein